MAEIMSWVGPTVRFRGLVYPIVVADKACGLLPLTCPQGVDLMLEHHPDGVINISSP